MCENLGGPVKMAHSFDDQKPPRLPLYAVQISDGPNKGKKAR